jgi:hypothetical protein
VGGVDGVGVDVDAALDTALDDIQLLQDGLKERLRNSLVTKYHAGINNRQPAMQNNAHGVDCSWAKKRSNKSWDSVLWLYCRQ